MSDETPKTTLDGVCTAEDPSTCDHEHRTIWDVDPLLGALADLVEKHGIKRGGITYDTEC